MSRKAKMQVLALAAIAAVGVAACGNSGSHSAANGSKTSGKTLVIEGTPLSPMTDDFNPYDQAGTGYVINSIGLVNEPLYIYNNMKPTQAPIPMLASGAPTWSSDGKSMTVPVRTGVKWSDGKAFTASDVAFTFNMIKSHSALYTSGAPTVASATATSPTSVTLNFNDLDGIHGRYKTVPRPVPYIPGMEVLGVVEAAGTAAGVPEAAGMTEVPGTAAGVTEVPGGQAGARAGGAEIPAGGPAR